MAPSTAQVGPLFIPLPPSSSNGPSSPRRSESGQAQTKGQLNLTQIGTPDQTLPPRHLARGRGREPDLAAVAASPPDSAVVVGSLRGEAPEEEEMWRLRIAEGGGDPWLRTKNGHLGRQVWEFDAAADPEELASVEAARQGFALRRHQLKHSADLLMRNQFAKENPLELRLPAVKMEEREDVTEEAVSTTLKRAISRLSTLQGHDGHWPGDYGGPMFLMPGLIITLYVTGALNTVLSSQHQMEIRRYLYNHQNEDGGWGLHIEGPSTMFGSALTYVSLRFLGERMDSGDGAMEKGQKWILDHGGATYITSWGKFWLSVLGVYDWTGNNPVPPEAWLLPHCLPFHSELLGYQ